MTTWIFLRGLTRECRHWGSLPQQWQAAGLGQPVLLDLPGNGALARMPAPATVGGMVASARQSARVAGLPPPYRILAMSLGAMVAAEWARAHPGEIAGLVLINTSMRPFSGVTHRLRPRNWPVLLRVAADWHNRAYCERVIHHLTCARADKLEADLEQWREIAASAPVGWQSALRQLLAAARYRASSVAPRCPTLVLSSLADRLVNPLCSERIAQAWGVPLVRHPWAGHDLPHDDPDWLCAAVARDLTPG